MFSFLNSSASSASFLSLKASISANSSSFSYLSASANARAAFLSSISYCLTASISAYFASAIAF
jgi:hypothetical protein